MVCSASASDQEEVSFSGCDEENYIPSFSSGSDSTDDCEGEEEPAEQVLPLSGIKICSTKNQGGRVWKKKTARKMDHKCQRHQFPYQVRLMFIEPITRKVVSR